MQIAAERKSNIKLLLHLCCLWAQSFGKCCEDALYYTLIPIQNLIYHGHLRRSFDVRRKRGWACLCDYEVGSLHHSWFVELDAWHPQKTQSEFWCPKTRPPPATVNTDQIYTHLNYTYTSLTPTLKISLNPQHCTQSFTTHFQTTLLSYGVNTRQSF